MTLSLIKSRKRRILLSIAVLTLLPSNSNSWSPTRFVGTRLGKTFQPPSVWSAVKKSAPPMVSQIVSFRKMQDDLNDFDIGEVDSAFESQDSSEADMDLLQEENNLLRDAIRKLAEENAKLKQRANKIVLESFEGEGRMFRDMSSFGDDIGMTMTGDGIAGDEAALWCDELEGDVCPLEPTISFGEALRDRAYWLVGLLVMQSLSGIILVRNEALLADHPVIIYFLTMLVGAGGNAGNQASVRVIRGLALGTLNEQTRNQFLAREFKMAVALSGILSVAGFCRAIFFKTPLLETVALTSALSLIVFSSVCLGAVLPILLEFIGVDPAHSSTSIQVIMDILGVFLAVIVSKAILDGPLGAFLMAKLGW